MKKILIIVIVILLSGCTYPHESEAEREKRIEEATQESKALEEFYIHHGVFSCWVKFEERLDKQKKSTLNKEEIMYEFHSACRSLLM